MSTSVAEALARTGATRLVHFTPSMNLDGIFGDGMLRDAVHLGLDGQPHYVVTDSRRFDSHPELICCAFQYPNAYYQAQARAKPNFANYPDWVCLVINVDVVLRPGTVFHPCNAAKGSGAYGETGGDGLLRMWASPSSPAGYMRSPNHLTTVPTDLQAEVQVPGPIALSAISAIVTSTPEKARELFGHYKAMGHAPQRVEWRSAPMFFDKYALAGAIQSGTAIPETVWVPSAADLQ